MVRQPANAQVIDHAATLNRLFDEKAFSWTLAIEDLETVLPGGVQVATLEPIRDSKSGRITLHMRVVGPRDKAVELMQNLERSRRFMTPRLTGESSEVAANGSQQLEPVSPTNRVNFDLLADYNLNAPVDRPKLKKDAHLEEVSASPATVKSSHRASPQGTVPALALPHRAAPHPGGTR
jgi:type IV pilus assembly protein PilN